ncbi:MAG: hypothetical protein C4K58_04700 [Flavobacteriaceae bacterium]|nr:MAG: hypothetical protein C4K58_04700 [Flavobacteriaceae bacterium]
MHHFIVMHFFFLYISLKPTHNVMKKLITMLAILSASFTAAQEIDLGVKGGLTIAADMISPGDQYKSRPLPGYYGGVFVAVPIQDKISVQLEGSYVEGKGVFRREYTLGPATINGKSNAVLKYINVPLLLKYNVTEKTAIQLGGFYNFVLGVSAIQSADVKQTSNGMPIPSKSFTNRETDLNHEHKTEFYGILAGVEHKLNDDLKLELRYSYGLGDFGTDAFKAKHENQKYTPASIQLGIAYSLF